MEGLEAGQPLFLFSQRLIRLLKLLGEGSTKNPNDKKGQCIDTERLKCFRHSQPTRRQPPPPLDRTIQLKIR